MLLFYFSPLLLTSSPSIQCLKPSVLGLPIISLHFSLLLSHACGLKRSVWAFPTNQIPSPLQLAFQGLSYLPPVPRLRPYKVIGGIFKNRKQLVSVSCLLHCKNLTLPSPTRPSVSLPVYSAITLYDSTLNLHTSTTGFLSVSLQC